jgi:hypothetical protein
MIPATRALPLPAIQQHRKIINIYLSKLRINQILIGE